ncbi:ABC transporter permease [Archangium violaceum]|uniref:ABC transporter permease n=1 Tax=Archangium violaceum Cb vi76 TaxID=1406225 RepID=A0A084SW89_9BACT|nr:ABC-2 family transporter protein [Archangium violaceum]KFA92724.1 hypothetical protein Q664_14100 [Archangium violaceum Cb vi76]
MSGAASLEGLRMAPRPRYLALALTGAQRMIAYPRTVLLNLLANLVWLAVSYQLWAAVFSSTAQVGSFDWARMRTYVLLVQALALFLNATDAVYRMVILVRMGDIATELLRPYDILRGQLAISTGAALVSGGLGAVVIAAVGFVWLDALPPISPGAAVWFAVSVLLGFLIRFLVGFITALITFWTMNWLGVSWAQTALVSILSGALIPLELYPEWLRSLALVFPFHGILHTPLAIYLGDLQADALSRALAVQAFWVVALWGLARLMWRPGVRALEIQGG